MLSEQQQRIMGYFIEEAKDHLNTIEQGLVNLQATIEDSEMVHEVFRAAHSVKGGAAMLGLNSIQHTAHRLEDYFKVLKECPQVRVDQKLETLFLRAYDTLQELVEQLQGPFGLTDDKAQEAMAAVEPVFDELNQHLNQLVQQVGGVPPEDVQLTTVPVAASVAAPPTSPPAVVEESALLFIFRNDVPARLREMLQLFKQPECAETREQLRNVCQTLVQLGEQFDLPHWCYLLTIAQQAIEYPDNTYRALAPLIIKDIKRAQELVLAGRSAEVIACDDLLSLLPAEDQITEAEADFDFEAGLAAFADANEYSSSGTTSEETIAADLTTVSSLEHSSEADNWFDAASSEDGDLGTPTDGDLGLDFGLEFDEALSIANGADADSLDLSFIDQLGNEESAVVEFAKQPGPEVGISELNSLADLFEGEIPELGLTWQNEEILAETDNSATAPEPATDFFNLFETDSSDELVLDDTEEEDLSGLLNAVSLQTNLQTSSSPESAELTADLSFLEQSQPIVNDPAPVELFPDGMEMFSLSEEAETTPSDPTNPTSVVQETAASLHNLDELFAGIEVDELVAEASDTSSELDSSQDLDSILAIDEISEVESEQSEQLDPLDPLDPLEQSGESDADLLGFDSLDELFDSQIAEPSTELAAEQLSVPESSDSELAEWLDAEAAAAVELSESTDLSNPSNLSEAEATEQDLPLAEPASENWVEEFEELTATSVAENQDEEFDLLFDAPDASVAESSAALPDDIRQIDSELAFESPFDIPSAAESSEQVLDDIWQVAPDSGSNSEAPEVAVDDLDSSGEAFNWFAPLEETKASEQAEAPVSSDHTASDDRPDLGFENLFADSSDSTSDGFDSFDNTDAGDSLNHPFAETATDAIADLDVSFLTNAELAEDTTANSEFSGLFEENALEQEATEAGQPPSSFETVLASEAGWDEPSAAPELFDEEMEVAITAPDFAAPDFAAPDFAVLDFESAGEANEVTPDEVTDEIIADTSLTNESSELAAESSLFELGEVFEESETLEPFSLESPSSDAEFDQFDPFLMSSDESGEGQPFTISASDSSMQSDLTPFPELGELSVEVEFADLEAILAASEQPTEDENQELATDTLADVADNFADLEAVLANDVPASIPELTNSLEPANNDDFSDLEALLDADSSLAASAPPPTPTILPGVAQPIATRADDEFSDLEALLQDADQKLGVGSSPIRGSVSTAARRPVRRNVIADQTMRVSVKHLDNLNNLVGEMVVNRNSLEQVQERLRQFLDNLLYQVQQLGDVGQRMRDLYERSLLESSLLSSRRTHYSAGSGHSSTTQTSHATGVSFDALEMDRFTGFHTLSQEMIELIVRVRESASDIDFVVEESDQITRNFRQITTQLQEGLTRSRMVPFAQTADRLPRGVRDNAIKYGKQAELTIEGRDTLIDKMIVEQLYDPMTHLVNNAIAHGVETPEERRAAGKSPIGRITIRAFHQGNQTVISVSDDGAGINPDKVKAKALAQGLITPADAQQMSRLEVYDLLFHHGFSTADQVDDLRGRGVGLDVVRSNLNEIRGGISIDSAIGKGTTFTIRLPLTLSISKALCCISNRARIAFPMDGVEDMLDVPKERIITDEQGRTCIQWRDMMLPFQTLAELLKYNRVLGRGSVYGGNQEEDMLSVIVLRSAGNYLALQVDQVLGEQEIVIKQLEGPVPKPIGVAGATVLGDGRIMPIADVLELIDLSQGRIRREANNALWDSHDREPLETSALKSDPTVLIVDDSITVRELLSMTFNKIGYRVEQARDGQEAWEKLRSGLPCDLVFCDIEMPRMDGLELLSRLQKDPQLSPIPVAMLTSRGADRHRQMAVQLGAKGYFTKPYLEEVLLDAAQRMLKGEVLVTGTIAG
ncbi:MAG: hypothetical protein Kow00121_31420 [Elainellaceae cyanobacterium]